MSMRITSGSSSCARASASWPSPASPMTSISGSCTRIERSPLRTRAWSSAISTRIFRAGVAPLMLIGRRADRGSSPCRRAPRPRSRRARLVEVYVESALPAQVVDEPRYRDWEVEASALLGLTQRGHVLTDVGERRASVARRLGELRREHRGVAVERPLASLEREHHSGELLREAIVQLLRDTPPLVRRGALQHVPRRRLLEHPRE